ncbi:unnamed protein product [Rangifer tarandus platyrhynchus]|uniref:Uncharacterized protein n=2 Tax=Rangifer tarandus platyrhynchus TaxID=3082113 RepID=A0ABN8YRU7_RANTA|nr:unnamed protein product [Rangifer tarandus platyrhynchus]CAI9701703.1 unnamed protein product [Rangifer tarandus platyrhynchus]
MNERRRGGPGLPLEQQASPDRWAAGRGHSGEGAAPGAPVERGAEKSAGTAVKNMCLEKELILILGAQGAVTLALGPSRCSSGWSSWRMLFLPGVAMAAWASSCGDVVVSHDASGSLRARNPEQPLLLLSPGFSRAEGPGTQLFVGPPGL